MFDYLWLRGKSPHRLVNTLLIANRVFLVTAAIAGVLYVVSAFAKALATLS